MWSAKHPKCFGVFFFRFFSLNNLGQVSVIADPGLLTGDNYPILIAAIDDGEPVPRETVRLIEVNFPRLNPTGTPGPTASGGTTDGGTTTETAVAAATLLQDDNMLAIILGAVAGLLLVIIIILVVYIIWR